MDVQRKKGLLDVCVLAVLQRGPSYGYRIVRDVSACIAVSESTLYPILRRLEANGLVTTCTQEHNGRTRKYYEITDPGRTRITAFLDEWEEVKHIYAFIKGTSETGDVSGTDRTSETDDIPGTDRTLRTDDAAEAGETNAAGIRPESGPETFEANGTEEAYE